MLNLVDISHCGLTKVSRIITWMTCDRFCWKANGSDKIYDQTNESFRVYLNQYGAQALKGNSPLRANFAKQNKFELHYEVKGIYNEIPGSSNNIWEAQPSFY